jgi:hypothetical protein
VTYHTASQSPSLPHARNAVTVSWDLRRAASCNTSIVSPDRTIGHPPIAPALRSEIMFRQGTTVLSVAGGFSHVCNGSGATEPRCQTGRTGVEGGRKPELLMKWCASSRIWYPIVPWGVRFHAECRRLQTWGMGEPGIRPPTGTLGRRWHSSLSLARSARRRRCEGRGLRRQKIECS